MNALDRLADALHAERIPFDDEPHWLVVRCAEGVLVVTPDDVRDSSYLLGVYPGSSWQDGDMRDEVGTFAGLTLDEVVAELTASAKSFGGVK